MTQAERAADIFALLARERGTDPDLTIRESDVSVIAGHVSHALDTDGRPAILVPLPEGQPLPEDSGTRVVTIRARELLDGETRRPFLVVRCEERALNAQFALFADDLLAAIAQRPDAPQIACTAILERWQELMAAPPSPLLGRTALVGLLAELHVLETLAAHDPLGALGAWCGPEGSRHDFATGKGAIEVKATTGREGFEVQIHGVLQLELPDHGSLTLYAEQLEPVHQGGDSVPGAVERAQQLGVPRQGLRDRLEAVGFRDSDAEIYRTVRFSLLRRAIAEVDSGFPRIVRSSFADPSLPDRTTDISYNIDLADWAVSASDRGYADRLGQALWERR